MNLCSAGHDEVCHETRKCPVCEMKSEKDKAISELEEEILDLQSTINELEHNNEEEAESL